jgi:uncharacterized membrane protein YqjE
MTDARDRETKRNFGTLLALMGLVLCGVCLILLVAIIMPQAAGLLAVVFGMALFIAIHYITWGWWMLRMRPGDLEDDGKNESAKLKYDETPE